MKNRTTVAGLTSAFDDEKRYELTEFGKQFVHYAMNELTVSFEFQETKQESEQQQASS